MALGTVPSPLYGLYRARDHFSLFMVTVAFAVYAVGVIVALLLAGHLSDLYGRRRLLLPAVGISIVSADRLRGLEEPRGPPGRPVHQRDLDRDRRVDRDRVPRRAARYRSAGRDRAQGAAHGVGRQRGRAGGGRAGSGAPRPVGRVPADSALPRVPGGAGARCGRRLAHPGDHARPRRHSRATVRSVCPYRRRNEAGTSPRL